MDVSVTVQNEQAILQAIAGIPQAIDVGTRDIALTLRKLVGGRTPVGIGPSRGEMKGSWSNVHRESGGYSFGSDREYATVLEEGLYEGVGPRTVRQGGQIYSRQAPGGMITPLIEDDAIMERATQLVVDEIIRGMSNAGA